MRDLHLWRLLPLERGRSDRRLLGRRRKRRDRGCRGGRGSRRWRRARSGGNRRSRRGGQRGSRSRNHHAAGRLLSATREKQHDGNARRQPSTHARLLFFTTLRFCFPNGASSLTLDHARCSDDEVIGATVSSDLDTHGQRAGADVRNRASRSRCTGNLASKTPLPTASMLTGSRH